MDQFKGKMVIVDTGEYYFLGHLELIGDRFITLTDAVKMMPIPGPRGLQIFPINKKFKSILVNKNKILSISDDLDEDWKKAHAKIAYGLEVGSAKDLPGPLYNPG